MTGMRPGPRAVALAWGTAAVAIGATLGSLVSGQAAPNPPSAAEARAPLRRPTPATAREPAALPAPVPSEPTPLEVAPEILEAALPADLGEEGGRYAPLTDDGILAEAPETEPATWGSVEPTGLLSSALDTPSVSAAQPAPARRRGLRDAVAGLSTAEALRHPLLVRTRGSRAIFHATGSELDDPAGGLVGEWAVVGRCERVVRMAYSPRSDVVGGVRGVGRAARSGEGAELAVAVPRRACRAAAARAWFPTPLHGVGAEALGFATPPDGTAVMVREGDRLWLATPAGAAVAERADGGWRVAWRSAADDPPMRLIAVYRRGDGVEGWFSRLGTKGRAGVIRVFQGVAGWRVDAAAPAEDAG